MVAVNELRSPQLAYNQYLTAVAELQTKKTFSQAYPQRFYPYPQINSQKVLI